MKRRGAFTLIELLVVIAIMVIIAGILFPTFAMTRDAARRTRCISNLKQLAFAHLMYVQDNDDVLPSWYIQQPKSFLIWPQFLWPYYLNNQILDEGLTSAADKKSSNWLADYALCAWGPGGYGTQEGPYWRWPGSPMPSGTGLRPMVMADVRRPAETMQFADGGTDSIDSYIRPRHQNGMLNGAFLDGHAKLVTDAQWTRLGHDNLGYFFAIAAADR